MRMCAFLAGLFSFTLVGACLAGEACKIIPVPEAATIGDPALARLSAVAPGSDEMLITSIDGKRSCRFYVENSTSQYSTSNGKYFIFDSSSGSNIKMIVWDWSRCKAVDSIQSSSTFLVKDNRITANSYCDCPAPGAKQCTCYSASVVQFGSGCDISRDDKEAEKITMTQTGVSFLGKAKVGNPGTSDAAIESR